MCVLEDASSTRGKSILVIAKPGSLDYANEFLALFRKNSRRSNASLDNYLLWNFMTKKREREK